MWSASPVAILLRLVGIAFVTMAVGVNARTAFSLLFPPILDEFGWDRGYSESMVAKGSSAVGFRSRLRIAQVECRTSRILGSIHQSLRITPAMAAGVTTKLWSLTDMLRVIEDWETAWSFRTADRAFCYNQTAPLPDRPRATAGQSIGGLRRKER